MSEKRKIKVTKNGPYLVSGNVPMQDEKIVNDAGGLPVKWKITKKYPAKAQYSLCRCGHSKNKPFCDQSHVGVSFNGKETAGNVLFAKQAEVIIGPELILQDLSLLCVHARFCDRGGGIWELTRKSNKKDSKKTAIEEAYNCPSGRLVIKDKKSQKAIEPAFDQSISATTDAEGVVGPLWVKGGIPIESAKGEIYENRNRVTLCQCGLSKNKPFCDGSHYQSIENKINPIGNLTIEHSLITIMLRVLEKINGKISKGIQVDASDLNDGMFFLKVFVDKCHHGKEEDWLFPAMKSNTAFKKVKLIGTLIEEHRQARDLIQNLAEAVSKKKKDRAKFRDGFLENSKKYIILSDRHVVKENMILFGEARHTISQNQMKKLEEGFEDLEKTKIGPGRHEELLLIIQRLKEIYL